MGQGTSSNRRRQKEAQDRNSRSYLLQAIALLIFAGLMLYVFSYYTKNDYKKYNLTPPNWLNTLVTACTCLVVGCVLTIIFYSCECNPVVRFVVAAVIMIGGILFISGYNDLITNDFCPVVLNQQTCNNDEKANYWAMPVLCLAVCIVVSVQICTELLNDEEKRVVAQCFTLILFAFLLEPYYYDANQNNLSSEEKSIETGGTILWIACAVTIVVFLAMNNQRGDTIIRMILVGGIVAGAVILFSGYSSYVNNVVDKYYPDPTNAFKLNILAPGILALLVAIVLAIDVLVK